MGSVMGYHVTMAHVPGWRNWQTRRTQNPVLAREWEFDPPSGHHLNRVDHIRCEGRNAGQHYIVDGVPENILT